MAQTFASFTVKKIQPLIYYNTFSWQHKLISFVELLRSISMHFYLAIFKLCQSGVGVTNVSCSWLDVIFEKIHLWWNVLCNNRLINKYICNTEERVTRKHLKIISYFISENELPRIAKKTFQKEVVAENMVSFKS